MDWFRHDLAAHDDRKIRLILKKGGLAALGAFWWITEMLYAAEGHLTDAEVSQELEIMDGTELREILLDSGLFILDESGMWSSNRILDEIRFEAERKEHFRTIGQAGGKRTSSVRQAYGKRMPSVRQAPIPMTNDHKDYNVSRDFQGEDLNINNKSQSDQTDIVCPEPEKSGSRPSEKPQIVGTFLLNDKSEFEVTQDMLNQWKELYPGVNVEQELRNIKGWCIANPNNRKTRNGAMRFVTSWLAREQNSAKRIPQHNYDTIRGTNIQMSLVADGTRPDYQEPEVKFE